MVRTNSAHETISVFISFVILICTHLCITMSKTATHVLDTAGHLLRLQSCNPLLFLLISCFLLNRVTNDPGAASEREYRHFPLSYLWHYSSSSAPFQLTTLKHFHYFHFIFIHFLFCLISSSFQLPFDLYISHWSFFHHFQFLFISSVALRFNNYSEWLKYEFKEQSADGVDSNDVITW